MQEDSSRGGMVLALLSGLFLEIQSIPGDPKNGRRWSSSGASVTSVHNAIANKWQKDPSSVFFQIWLCIACGNQDLIQDEGSSLLPSPHPPPFSFVPVNARVQC